MASHEQEPIEVDFLRTSIGGDYRVHDAVVTPVPNADDVYVGDRVHVRIEGRIGGDDEESEDDVEFAAFPLIYTLGLLSFIDAKPRGNSVIEYRDKDDWTSADMLRNMRFVRGELRFYADYVRGRMMKTTVVVRKDGTFVLETVNRGEAAVRWMAKLRGEEGAAMQGMGTASVDESEMN